MIPSSIVIPSLVVSAAAGIAIFRFKASVITTLLVCAVLGVGWKLVEGS